VVTLRQLVFFLGWDWFFSPDLPSPKWFNHKIRYVTLQLKQEQKMKMTEPLFPRACKSFSGVHNVEDHSFPERWLKLAGKLHFPF